MCFHCADFSIKHSLQEGNVWFDRTQISPDVKEHSETLEETAQQLSKFIEKVVDDGVELNRIVIGMHTFIMYIFLIIIVDITYLEIC